MKLLAVYTQPDRPKGRGHGLAASPVKQAALRRGLAVRQPERIKQPEVIAELAALRPEAMVVVGYGQIIPQASSRFRRSASSTCTPRCCRATAARRRSVEHRERRVRDRSHHHADRRRSGHGRHPARGRDADRAGGDRRGTGRASGASGSGPACRDARRSGGRKHPAAAAGSRAGHSRSHPAQGAWTDRLEPDGSRGLQ